jgi:hypothetical protein
MFDPTTFTGLHTWLSLIALGAGLVVVHGLIHARNLPLWTGLFLATAVATSVTGFGFPLTSVLPSHVVGGFALVALMVAILARYGFHLVGAWRWIYAVTASISVYFLVFVAISQAFLKIPALQAMAPTLSEAPFAMTQLAALVLFAGLAMAAVRRFHPRVATGAYA